MRPRVPEFERPFLRLPYQEGACVRIDADPAAGRRVRRCVRGPGDFYRLAFVTSTTRDAVPTDIADYNAFVTATAEAVPELLALGTTWSVIGSTASVDARDNTGTDTLGGVAHPTMPLGLGPVRVGATRTGVTESWINWGWSQTAPPLRNFYAMSGVLTVAAPEPVPALPGVAPFVLGLGLLVVARTRSRKRSSGNG